ncbi:HDOD domain-containing protein [Sulfurimonas sp. HSL-1716]|uniref:HDOD domain-containing protein n=1 Tax=Hydrocurvibacter sulfurireducens TaxID=3131937 RepID=UPI0031F8CA84
MKISILESIKSLPPLPKTITQIQKIFLDPESSIADLVKVIEDDPMIIANLLKAANSPLYSFKKDIKSVSQAVSLFGMSMTRSIILSNSVRKLLNVDMEPYATTSEKFAEVSSKQAALIYSWYKKIDKEKADKLFLASLLQETGKILIASYIIQHDEVMTFKSEIEMTHNIATVEKSYVDETTATVTAAIFEHWEFDTDFVDMIRYSDFPHLAPPELAEYSTALNIVKTIIPVNNPLSEMSINIGLKKASDAGYDHELLEDCIDDMLEASDQNRLKVERQITP